MLGKVVITGILLFGILKPRTFLKVTESWRRDVDAMSDQALTTTKIMCGLAIVLVWLFL